MRTVQYNCTEWGMQMWIYCLKLSFVQCTIYVAIKVMKFHPYHKI
jgi:hypothetical protein